MFIQEFERLSKVLNAMTTGSSEMDMMVLSFYSRLIIRYVTIMAVCLQVIRLSSIITALNQYSSDGLQEENSTSTPNADRLSVVEESVESAANSQRSSRVLSSPERQDTPAEDVTSPHQTSGSERAATSSVSSLQESVSS